jgi:hypothetical protein
MLYFAFFDVRRKEKWRERNRHRHILPSTESAKKKIDNLPVSFSLLTHSRPSSIETVDEWESTNRTKNRSNTKLVFFWLTWVIFNALKIDYYSKFCQGNLQYHYEKTFIFHQLFRKANSEYTFNIRFSINSENIFFTLHGPN